VIRRFVGVLAAVVVAYLIAVLLGPLLPAIRVQTEASRPLTFPEILSKYLVHAPDERLHLLTTPRTAEWNNANGLYVLYDLANAVPALDDTYAPTGGNVESLYETLLLSIKAGDDVALAKLQKEYLAARNKALSYAFREKTKQERAAAQQKALEALLAYADKVNAGPAQNALGKALRDYYGATAPYVKPPEGEARNYRSVIASPPLASLADGSRSIPVIDILVPVTQSDTAAISNLAVRAQQFRIAEVSLSRPWVDPTLLTRTSGPWHAGDPKLFGPQGALARIPIRLALVERPVIETSTASATSATSANGAGGATVGPFVYSASEISASGNMLSLRPATSQWLVIAVISREL